MHPHTSSTSKLHSKALAATRKSCLLTWVQWPQQFSIQPMGNNPMVLCLNISPLEHQHHTTAVQCCLKANKQATIWWSVGFILIPVLVGFCRNCQVFPGLSTTGTLFQPDRKIGSRSAFTSCPVQDGNGTSYALAQELSNLKLEHRSSAQVKLSSCTKLSPCKITAETGMAAPLLSPVN